MNHNVHMLIQPLHTDLLTITHSSLSETREQLLKLQEMLNNVVNKNADTELLSLQLTQQVRIQDPTEGTWQPAEVTKICLEPTSYEVSLHSALLPVQSNDPVTNICQAADKQLFTLVEWAKRIPHFSDLPLDDQVILLRAGWNELLIASFSHRSISVKDGILLATGLHVHRSSAHSAGVGSIFDRVLTELVSKMKDMQMDKTELGCLRAIVLFNPDAKGLSNPGEVESLREKVYASLEAYTKHKYPDQPGRFAKLLLRLPALRSIGLKCLEHLFFFKLIGDTPIDTFLMEMLEAPHQMT
ncbi:retinoic acid receptor RXR-gamma-A-like [Scyliorhinus canicula]|uniref:retinoic acid receptor RXR-gamma-A-like n=1 Tax=Scyliorhinus canicula TaxID=7830 RepID=UPI0018F34C38|nr:retinoic acid receptor RXR-gamma-A-like [Scyliorhinus canicula]